MGTLHFVLKKYKVGAGEMTAQFVSPASTW